jgi:hypothetical protein
MVAAGAYIVYFQVFVGGLASIDMRIPSETPALSISRRRWREASLPPSIHQGTCRCKSTILMKPPLGQPPQYPLPDGFSERRD